MMHTVKYAYLAVLYDTVFRARGDYAYIIRNYQPNKSNLSPKSLMYANFILNVPIPNGNNIMHITRLTALKLC